MYRCKNLSVTLKELIMDVAKRSLDQNDQATFQFISRLFSAISDRKFHRLGFLRYIWGAHLDNFTILGIIRRDIGRHIVQLDRFGCFLFFFFFRVPTQTHEIPDFGAEKVDENRCYDHQRDRQADAKCGDQRTSLIGCRRSHDEFYKRRTSKNKINVREPQGTIFFISLNLNIRP